MTNAENQTTVSQADFSLSTSSQLKTPLINKIDKPARRIAEVEDELGDLFLELGTDDSQLHYPVYYAIGRGGRIWSA